MLDSLPRKSFSE